MLLNVNAKIIKMLTIGNLFTIMIRTTITLTFELVTLNVVPNIYILGKSKYSIQNPETSSIMKIKVSSQHIIT